MRQISKIAATILKIMRKNLMSLPLNLETRLQDISKVIFSQEVKVSHKKKLNQP